MIEIICSSPLHILTAIALRETEFKDKAVSVLLVDYSAQSEYLYHKLVEQQIFKRVDYIHAKDVWRKYTVESNKLFKVKFLRTGIKMIDALGLNWRDIDAMLYPYHEPFAILLARNLKKAGIACKYMYYDDGTAAYANLSNAVAENPGKIELLFNVPIRFYIPDLVYMFAPELTDISKKAVVERLRLPRSKHFVDIANQVFDYKPFEQRKYIYFDQCSNDQESPESKELLSKSLALLNQCFNRSEIYIKKHPKRKGESFENAGWTIFPEPQYLPFELCMLNGNSLENLTLVSNYSTACMMPKLLLDYEPNVVFLYQILKDKETKKIADMIKRIESMYRKNRVFKPNDQEDLKKIMEGIG